MKITLTDDLLVGVDLIDNQHRELFARGNRLLGAEELVPSKAEFLKALDFLSDYVWFHFAAEEALMAERSYGEMELHVRQHRHFRSEVLELRSRAEGGDETGQLRLRMHFLLTDWFFQHIKHSDTKLARFVAQTSSS